MCAEQAAPVIPSLVLALLLHHLIRRCAIVDDGATILTIAGDRYLEQRQTAGQSKVSLIDVADAQIRSRSGSGSGTLRVHRRAVPPETEVGRPVGGNRNIAACCDTLMQ